MSFIMDALQQIAEVIDENFKDSPPSEVMAITAVAMTAGYLSIRAYQYANTLSRADIYDAVTRAAGHIPFVDRYMKRKIAKQLAPMLEAQRQAWEKFGPEYYHTMPDEPMSREAILARFDKLQEDNVGHSSGGEYIVPDKETLDLLAEVWKKTAFTNPLHPEWPLIQLMHAEIISMSQELFHGEPGGPGLLTHGGTTSILEAMNAYALYARVERGIEKPVIIIPKSAHAAFLKARAMFDVEVVIADLDENDCVSIKHVKALANKYKGRLAGMVGSANSFPNGAIDHITQLGQIALEHDVPLHVDSCLGGLLLANSQDYAHADEIPICDFRVPGVTSISFDWHKYGFAPKGTSTLLFSKNSYMKHYMYVVHALLEWYGGLYVTNGMDGSRSGADIAVLWAHIMSKGKKFFRSRTKEILDLKDTIQERVQALTGVKIVNKQSLSVLGLRTDTDAGETFSIFIVAEEMKKRGYTLLYQQSPDGIHFVFTAKQAAEDSDFDVDEFIQALEESITEARKDPERKPKGHGAVYGVLNAEFSIADLLRGKAELPPSRSMQQEIATNFIRLSNTLPDQAIPLLDNALRELTQKRQELAEAHRMPSAAKRIASAMKA